jgi:predicted permease
MQTLLQDLRYALRTLAKYRLFAVVAIGALAIGIGVNTAIFSIVNGVLLRPLPFADPEELVAVLRKNTRASGNDQMPVAPANYLDVKRQNRSFVSMGAAELGGGTLTGDGVPEAITGLRMTASVFEVLGTQPLLGRVFRVEEEEPGRHRVIVLTHRLWQRRFGADPSIVGRSITLSGEPFVVIGVMPAAFRFPPFWGTSAEMYIPLAFSQQRWNERGGNSLRLFARLIPGVTVAQAGADIDTIAVRLAASFPQTNTNVGFSIKPLHEIVVGKVRNALLTLLAAVGFVLLIACANVANLLVARSIARRTEIAVRTALGADRKRLVRQLLTESLLLSTIAGILGTILAAWTIDLLKTALGNSVPRLDHLAIDGGVLLFALGLSLVSGVLFGFAPALQTSRADVSSALKENARSVHGGGSVLRRALVASEVALTVMLLAAAGLLTRSFVNMLQLNPGFRSDHLLTANVNLKGTSMEGERQPNFYRTAVERIAALPGVASAAVVNHVPLAGDTWSDSFLLDDRPAPAPSETFSSVIRVSSPGYFRTMNTRILRGREFEPSDVNGTTFVAVINETMAKRYWPGMDPIGRRLRFGSDAPWLNIVGVVEDVLQREWTGDAGPQTYVCYSQVPANGLTSFWSLAMTFVVRTTGDPNVLVKPMQEVVWSQDARIPFTAVATMDEVVSGAVRQPRVYAVLLGVFAFMALALATIGIYGVVAYSVAQRTQEMGVRMAVGASAPDLVRLVVGSGLKVVALGAAAGLIATLALSHVLSTLLFGLKPNDMMTLCGVALLIFSVAAAATYIPARRVSRIDPIAALRIE